MRGGGPVRVVVEYKGFRVERAEPTRSSPERLFGHPPVVTPSLGVNNLNRGPTTSSTVNLDASLNMGYT